ncbi:chromosome segregation protein [Peribacillus deserti]|uniref:Chromosome partition protein Smc n=1 Tax=Peribacillus deserti TaxID=673318 RepID=A0ABS2QGJ9_9BACI|nr:chromosome segregation protein SMC [Peribacillus deserti]MBM7692300.1 chromosome segregation protein [Peribacillus deserti]
MFLKRLDVVGFKSFAERIGVEFVPGVTAVVGPNGSGKSNIIDSIRWVLGEQSAKSLRGGKMEDIIFAGSDSRKALNFAEVTLTLDNEKHFLPLDYQEVSVTRRVYRSGDSEFFINKQPCRLKDIINLFMDSGLGKEAFSIISQGKVEEILSSKPEERRSIFEEAAGVLKYKNRKKKAEHKLYETQDNLNRVQDIIHELESQVEPLKIQASIAKEYLEKKEDLKQFEVGLTVYEIESLHKKWEVLSSEYEQHKDLELKSSAELQKKEALVEQSWDQMTALDESINSLQDVLLHVSEELEKLEGRKEVLKERKKNAAQNKQQLEKAKEAAYDRLQILGEEEQNEKHSLAALEAAVKELQIQLNEKQKEMSLLKVNVEETIEALKSDYIDWLNKQAAAKNEYQLIEQQLRQAASRTSRLDEENAKHVSERNRIHDIKTRLADELAQLQAKMEEQIHSFRSQQNQLENLKNNYQKQEKTLYQAFQYLQQAKSRKEMLEEMEEDYAGFFQGVKEILKAKNTVLQGIEGAVAELVQVPREYQTAIEIALGGAAQHVVVNNEENARRAIGFLKKNSYGRATFLPLTAIKAKTVPYSVIKQIENSPAFVGQASSLISFDPKYEDVIGNLLGTIIVTADLRGANELAKITGHRYRFVTLDGDVVNPGGSMTGGAVKQKNASLLSRKGELEDLKKKLGDMEDKTSKLQQHVKVLKNDVQAQELNLEEIRTNGEKLRLSEQSLKGEIREVEVQEKNINDRLSVYDLEKMSAQEENNARVNRLQEVKKMIASCEEEILKLNEEITMLTEQKQNQATSREALTEELNELKIELATKKEQLQHQRDKFSRIVEEKTNLKYKYAEYSEDLSLLQNEMESDFSGENQLEEAAKHKLKEKNETIMLISERRQERLNLHAELETEEIRLKELKRQYKGLTEALKDEEVKLNRLDVELDNKLVHLQKEYFLSFEAAKENHPLAIPAEEARKKVKLIKMAIEELEPVNIGAIDEYARVSERYEFLLEQKNDLQEAKDTLFQVIGEMDEEMKRRFHSSFYAIKDQFAHVFPALFGGGRAELKLTEPQDLLNTGVEIVAQPPGKKLQNLGLLSGGERALTAIALLFAILKVRPVPFCILDEVEAALDDANVYRFSQYLKKFSKETQFIVITHRKGTMEEADVLYGVTMQESGVSKLVSVRLHESKELVQS